MSSRLGGVRRLWRDSPGPPCQFNASKPVWRSGHVQEDFWERLIKSPVGCLNLAGARPPALTAKLSKPRCPPAGLYFWSTRAAGWLVEPNVLKVRFRSAIVGL